MDDAPAEYVRLAPERHAPRALRETAEARWWKGLRPAAALKLSGGVSALDYCPAGPPHHLAATAGTRLLTYDGSGSAGPLRLRRAFNRFKDVAYGGAWRGDGAALIAGGADGLVQVFDASSRSLLRRLAGHAAPVHAARFGGGAADGPMSSSSTSAVSAGDDATVRVWDVAAGAGVARWDGHTDYVRALASPSSSSSSSSSSSIWASGGYDHTVRLWDARVPGGGTGTALDHGHPVESLAYLPGGALLVSAGGPVAKVWDVLSGRATPLAVLSTHQKTVTSLAVAAAAGGPAGRAAPRLVTGSLDGHARVFELDSFSVAASLPGGGPISALALSPDAASLAIGLADGSLCVRRGKKKSGAGVSALAGHKTSTVAVVTARRGPRRALTAAAGFRRYYLRGRGAAPDEGALVVGADPRPRASRRRPPAVDAALRRFRYRDALDAALATGRGAVIGALLAELDARGALPAAVGGRDAAGLLPLLAAARRAVGDPRTAAAGAALAHAALDAYAPALGASPAVDAALAALADRARGEAAAAAALERVGGAAAALRALSVGR
jgi:U3 small nucleolar RNA-associated protein 15